MNLLGGRAGFNSVTFESEIHSTTATRKGNDILVIKTIKENKETKLDNFFHKIPFIRAYWIMLKIFFTKLSLLLLILCLSLSYLIHKIPLLSATNNSYHFSFTWLIPLLLIIFFNKFTKTKYYHGAEHKVANDYEINGKVKIETAINQSCVNDNCGTNLFVGLVLIIGILFPLLHYWSGVLAWGLNYEVMRSDNKFARVIVKPIYFVGSLLQKYVFTREPSIDQLEVAVRAFRALEEENY